ncbi:MAG TPA: universal stress protein, partial [Flavobacteriales bacterium]|nr:universal stress protein [Flavobacteriales bacterium]
MAHVLLPTDFSDNALNAALYALRLFGDEGNTFTVVHSYGLTLNESGEPLPVMDPVASIATEQTAEFIARVR